MLDCDQPEVIVSQLMISFPRSIDLIMWVLFTRHSKPNRFMDVTSSTWECPNNYCNITVSPLDSDGSLSIQLLSRHFVYLCFSISKKQTNDSQDHRTALWLFLGEFPRGYCQWGTSVIHMSASDYLNPAYTVTPSNPVRHAAVKRGTLSCGVAPLRWFTVLH